MSEFEKEVEKAEKELEQSLMTVEGENTGEGLDDEYLGDLKMHAQEYQQKIHEAAVKAKDFAGEKFAVASEKFKELQDKDPRQLVEDAKDYARKNPGQTILISAAVGLVVGWLLKGRR